MNERPAAEIMVTKDPMRAETIMSMRINDSLMMRGMPDAIMANAAKQMVAKYVEVHFEEISAKIDTEAIAKQLALAVTSALAEKAINDGLEASKAADAKPKSEGGINNG